MKSSVTLKSFSALSSDVVQFTDASTSAIPESSSQPRPESLQAFQSAPRKSDTSQRELLRRRSTAPFVSAIPYHRWGLNE